MLVVGAVLPSGSAGAASQTATITIGPATQSQPTGAAQTYNINVACQGTGGSACGPNTTVTIPLDTTVTPPMTDPSWVYSATSGSAGFLLTQPTVVGSNLVFTLNDADFIGGFSGSIALKATPPNRVTPNNTSWSMLPTLTGGNIDPTPAATPAQSTATATPHPSVTKVTADGGSVYQTSSSITYNIAATCSAAATGNLDLGSGSLVDQLPTGVVYVSSNNGGVYDSVANTVTWTFASAAATPTGCATGSTGATSYQVMVTAPSTVPVTQPLTNVATFSGTGPDATVPAGITRSSNAQVPVNIVATPPVGPGTGYATITKSSLAPLVQPGVSGNQYIGTYPGNWVSTSTTPSYSVGAAAGSFQTTVTNTLVDTYQTQLVDPLPCLDVVSGNVYSSGTYNGSACAHPAFHTTVIQVTSAGYDTSLNGLGRAVASGWRPTATLIDGSSATLAPTGTVATTAASAYFSIPSGDVGRVASIVLPGDPTLMNHSLQLTVWGYTDASLASVNGSLNQLTNTATAVPFITLGSPLTPVQASASIFTVPEVNQLGISKSFGTVGGGPNGTTVLNLKGAVNTPQAPLNHNVVLTDLLPTGLHWANPVASGSFSLAQAGGTTSTTATVEDIQNYQGSGRELIRVTLLASAFSVAGSWTITPPTNFLEMTTPSALGVYANTDQIFLFGLAPSQISSSCTTPTQTGGGTSPATFQSSNPQDLAGDGNLSEDYCQNSASLLITGTGPAFSLTKTVQGNLDSVPRGALGIGTASNGGSGVYGLSWANVGSDNLNNAVIYDILPYVGDTGVSQGQAGVQRGSQFAPVFTGIGTLPSGVTVEYSQSTNPCRPEVFPNTSNPTCVNDWSATAPSPLGSVTALRFMSSATYSTGNGFSVTVQVALPVGVVNQVAWNSAATNAADVSNPGDIPLAAEPPKVGLTSPSTPTLPTQTSSSSLHPNESVSDVVTVAGTGGNAGALAWSLVGPVAAVAGSCTGVTWSGAAVVASGTVATTGDGPVITGPVAVGGVGCYSWTDALSSTVANAFPTPPAVAAGAAGEVVLVDLFAPTVDTTATLVSNPDGSHSVTDKVTVSGSGLGDTPQSPTATTLSWTLLGPAAPSAGSCASAPWSGAPVAGQGTESLTGDGSTVTPATVLRSPGCYSFEVGLAATTTAAPVSGSPGVGSETVQVSELSPAGGGAGGQSGGSTSGGQTTTGSGAGGLLALTGIELAGWLAAGIALVLAGVALLCTDRRRYHRAHRLR